MSKYKMGDEVSIKGRISRIDNTPGILCKYRIDSDDDWIWCREEDLIDGQSKTYEDGLTDAWELARKIGSYEAEKRVEIFADSDAYHFGYVLGNFTPQVARAILEAYEENKAIKVGDVVKVKTGAGSEHFGVVTQITANQNCACIVYADGSTEMNTANNMTKTNKHLDIEHLLEQIRG